MSVTRIMSLLACLAGSAPALARAGDLKGDARRLEGKWFARTPGLVWEVNFQVGRAVQIAMSGSVPTFTRAGVGRLSAPPAARLGGRPAAPRPGPPRCTTA